MIANAQQTQQANAVELTVLSAGAMRAALAELAPLFERSSGHKLIIEYGMVGKVEEKVVGDAPFDVAIVTRPPFDRSGWRSRTAQRGRISARLRR
jgi:molybdate transport system substrate-binding protein